MPIKGGMPQHAFNLLSKCEECRQQSGQFNFIHYYPKKMGGNLQMIHHILGRFITLQNEAELKIKSYLASPLFPYNRDETCEVEASKAGLDK